MIIIGLLVPSNDGRLNLASGTAASSPFVIAIQNAHISTLPSVRELRIFGILRISSLFIDHQCLLVDGGMVSGKLGYVHQFSRFVYVYRFFTVKRG